MKNYNFWSKNCWLTKVRFLAKNSDFWQKFLFLTKIFIFDKNLLFLSILEKEISIFEGNLILGGNFNVWQKFRFWAKQLPWKSMEFHLLPQNWLFYLEFLIFTKTISGLLFIPVIKILPWKPSDFNVWPWDNFFAVSTVIHELKKMHLGK